MEGILLANSLSRERANGLDLRGIGTPGSKLLNRRRKHLVYELLHSSVAVRVRPDFVQRLQSDVIDFEDLQARKIAQRRNAFFKIVIVPELNGSLEDDLANRALNALQGPSSIQRRPLSESSSYPSETIQCSSNLSRFGQASRTRLRKYGDGALSPRSRYLTFSRIGTPASPG